MQLAHKRKAGTILGNIVFLVLAAIIVFLFISYISSYQINKISKINEKYLITSNYLVPENYEEYKLTLTELNQDKYTAPITEYINLILEARKIDRYLEYSQLETQCVTRTTIARIEMQMQNRDLLLEKFADTYSKKLDKIHWSDYITALESYNIYGIYEKAQELELC